MNNTLHHQLRAHAISSQGLSKLTKFGKGLSGTLEAIEHLAYVQIDTLAVIERAHHHILFSRVPDYKPQFLNQLVKDKKIFEYWYHAASFLPMRDYRFALLQMQEVKQGRHRYFNNADSAIMKEIVTRIKSEGPLRLKDFEHGKESDAKFWKVGPTRRAFERLFMQGDLMVSERHGMQKQFDLRDNCLPSGIDLSMPSVEEYAYYLFESTLRAHSVFTFKQLIHLKTGKAIREAMRSILAEKLSSTSIVEVEGMTDVFACASVYENTIQSKAPYAHAKILSPFDNVLIHRERLSRLFNYEYRLECYVPAAKRIHGYFCLPVLFNNEFVARMDCKAHRKERRFEIIQFHLEAENINKTQFKKALAKELSRFIAFHHCDNSIDLDAFV